MSFKVIDVTTDIKGLTIGFYKEVYTTIYIIKTPKGSLLFDAASSKDDVEKSVIPFLQKNGITPQILKYIFVSHNHGDHAGGLPYLMKEYPETCIVSRSAKLKALYHNYDFIEPDDNYLLLDSLYVISIPGHTEDSCALLDNRTKTLLTGDCLQAYGVFSDKDWGTSIKFPIEYLEAVDKVRALDINNIFMSHDYYPCGNKASGRSAVDYVLNVCSEPLFRIKEIICENPHLNNEEIRKIYNSFGDIPTINIRVVAAVRATFR